MRAANKAPTAASKAAPLPAKLASLLREARWLLLVAVSMYVLLVLFTFDRADPGWSHSATAATVRNAGGHFGAWLADLLLYLFGVSAYWWSMLFLYVVVWGYRRLDGTPLIDRRPLIVALIGFLILITSSATIEALRLHTLQAQLQIGRAHV